MIWILVIIFSNYLIQTPECSSKESCKTVKEYLLEKDYVKLAYCIERVAPVPGTLSKISTST